jgi:hypothetical protein
MSDPIFDKSNATWTPAAGNAAAIAPLTNFSYDDNPPEVDSSGAGDTEGTHEAGRSDESAQVDGLGSPSAIIIAGGKGALHVNLGGTNENLAVCVVTEVTCEGRIDDNIKSTFKVVPAIAD